MPHAIQASLKPRIALSGTFWLSMHQLPAMSVADELGIFQALESGPATSAETAGKLVSNRRATDVLFSMLTAIGLTALRDGVHELTDVTRTYLLQKSPYYWGPFARTLGVPAAATRVPDPRAANVRRCRADDSRPSAVEGMGDGEDGARPGRAGLTHHALSFGPLPASR